MCEDYRPWGARLLIGFTLKRLIIKICATKGEMQHKKILTVLLGGCEMRMRDSLMRQGKSLNETKG